MMNENTPCYPANFTDRSAISVHNCHSSDLIFKLIMKIPVCEPYYNPQSGQPNSNDTILKGSHGSCSIKSVFSKFCKIYRKTPVPEFLF